METIGILEKKLKSYEWSVQYHKDELMENEVMVDLIKNQIKKRKQAI